MTQQQEAARRLRVAVLSAADLVTADATAYSSHPGTPLSPGKAASSSSGSSGRGNSLARQLSGGAYLRIRSAFAAAFDELLQPAPAPDQVHELWAALQDYLDRTVARADVALSAAEQLRAEKEQVPLSLLLHLATACAVSPF